MGAPTRYRRSHRREAAKGARVHPVPRGHRSARGFPWICLRAAGLVLHGETLVKKRQEMVRRFQEDEAIGFFVLSLKPGGAGLNLTAASHLYTSTAGGTRPSRTRPPIAFRIGQTRNVTTSLLN